MTQFFVLVGLAVGVLAIATWLGTLRLKVAHPPTGDFVEVEGLRVHIAVLGLPPGATGADPPLVLIHGASGNLEDMRLALGERLAASHRVIMVDRPGHGWSSRPDGDDYASPARQAEIVARALEKLGVRHAILIGHSWGGACVTAYALAFPQRTAGLVLISAPTHPWPGNPGWYNKVASLPYIGALFLHTCVYPLGLLMTNSALRSVFEPQPVPTDYTHRAAIRLVLRPNTFYSNARDLALLESFIAAQVPRYVDLRTPTVIITGDRDTTVSPETNARALAAILPSARLVLLKDVGHMPHHAAPEVVVNAIDDLVKGDLSAAPT
jgi:pimeloyl-ACP methyl ester carboxylesterase